jgi:hypothetical protein
MSLKVYFFNSHLDIFLENLGSISDEHGERFSQELSPFKKPYQGERNARKVSDCCWTMKRDVPDTKHR